MGGRGAWITGGATGMGLAIATALSARGMAVVVSSLTPDLGAPTHSSQNAYRPPSFEVEEALASIAAAGGDGSFLPLDLRSPECVSRAHAAARDRLGRIDVLVNAAGTGARHVLTDHPDELWESVLAINLTGPFLTTRLCLPDMAAAGFGRIINIASTAARIGSARQPAYCASKAGVLALTKTTALEGARHGVTCNAISPGFVPTKNNALALEHLGTLMGDARSIEERRRDIAKGYPSGRLVSTEEIAAAAAFLCSDGASGVNGENLIVAGGAIW